MFPSHDRKVNFAFTNDISVGDSRIVNSSSPLTLGVWNHVLITNDGSNTQNGMNVYVNGALNKSNSTNALTIYPGGLNNVFVGKRFDGVQLNGKIDDLIVFDATLGLTEAQGLYNAGSWIDPRNIVDMSKFRHWWKMGDNGTHDEIPDEINQQILSMSNSSLSNIVTDTP